jgi:hypothetical protein
MLEHMFDTRSLAAVDPHADEATLIEHIAWLERVKSAAAAGQARAAAALDQKRRAAEAAARLPWPNDRADRPRNLFRLRLTLVLSQYRAY